MAITSERFGECGSLCLGTRLGADVSVTEETTAGLILRDEKRKMTADKG